MTDSPALPEAMGAQFLALSELLSRFAALQGIAVPAYRFSLQALGKGGLDDEAPVERAHIEAAWLSRFATGKVRVVSPTALAPDVFPLLWLPASGPGPSIVVGKRAGGYAVLGDEALLDSADAQGEFFALETGQDQEAAREKDGFSAKDWFVFALQKHRRIFFEGVFASLMVSLLGLGSALYTMQVYDRVIPTKGFSTLTVLTVGVALAVVFEFMMKLVRARMTDLACKAIDAELSSVFFERAMAIRLEARPKTIGTFASQLRQFESVRNFMTSTTLFLLADAPFALLFIFVIFTIAGPVALVPLVIVPLALIAGFLLAGPIERYSKDNMEESNRKNGLLIEAIDGAESIKAANAEWKLAAGWAALTEKIAGSELKVRLLTTVSQSVAQMVQQATYVGIIFFGAYAISEGTLTMGGLIACSIISGRALTPLAQVPNLVTHWKRAQISLDVLDNIMRLPFDGDGERRLVPRQAQGELKLEEVRFEYAEGQPCVDLAALNLNAGERVALLGAVGSGKSTLLKLLAGLYRPTQGRVFFDGSDMALLDPEFLREHIGYLPQDVRLFNGSLRENLVLGLPAFEDSRILAAAQATGLAAAIQNHPAGLEIPIAEGGRGLSGGQRQLVGLTRLLLMRPSLLLLDEPTASMDAQLEARVMQHLFEELPPEASVLVATHKLGVLRHVSRIIVMDKGRAVLDGPRDQILAQLNQRARGESGTGEETKA